MLAVAGPADRHGLILEDAMSFKIKITKIKEGKKDFASPLFGVSDAVTGVFVSFVGVEGTREGNFYAGQNSAPIWEGREAEFFFRGVTAGEALAILQASAETVNYAPVERVVKWRVDVSRGLDVHKGYHGKIAAMQEVASMTFATEAEAEAEADDLCKYQNLSASCVRVVSETTFGEPVCTDAEEIINLTQHPATTEQVEVGVVEPTNKGAVQAALTFDAIPAAAEMAERAELLTRIAVDSGCKRAMIGGAPFFMAPLERALLAAGVQPVYAFSVRDSREEPDGNGGVRKINVFRHVGFVEAE
jgi:hypothetical protein